MASGEKRKSEVVSKQRPQWQIWLFQLSILSGLVALAVFKVLQDRPQKKVSPTWQPFTAVKTLTDSPGFESFPALAPNGQAVSYAWQKDPLERRTNTHIKTLAFESLIQLTANAGQETYAAWNPQSSTIAFARLETSGVTGIYQMAMVGGKEQKILETHSRIHGLDWSPDGHALLIAEQKHAAAPSVIVRVTLQDSFRLQLTYPPATGFGDSQPVFSPDGKQVAFVRSDGLQRDRLLLISETGEGEALILNHAGKIRGLAWHPDGKQLLFGSMFAGKRRIRRVNVEDKSIRTLLANRAGTYPTLSDDGKTMVFEEIRMKTQTRIFKRYGGDKEGHEVPWSQGHSVKDVRFSPDGQRLAYISSRSGGPQIWVVLANEAPQKLTQFQDKDLQDPIWSPTGEILAFTAFDDSGTAIYIQSPDQEESERVFHSAGNVICRGWTVDGRSLYLASDQTGSWEIWRLSLGESQLEQVTQAGGFFMDYNPESEDLFYSKFGDSTIHRRSPGGEVESVLEDEDKAANSDWQWGRDGLYFLRNTFGQMQLCVLEFRTGRTIVLNRFHQEQGVNFSVSPDGQSYIVTQQNLEDSKLMLATVNPF